MDEDVKILCVDDEVNVLRSLERLFLDSDYEILTASSGEEGLEILGSTERVQLIISDYRMPKMNGVDFLKKVCDGWPHTVRIVLSGYANTVAIVEAINEGKIYKFIPKPWNDDELKVNISTALEYYFAKEKNIALAKELEIKNSELTGINVNLEKLVAERTADLQRQNRILNASQNILDSLPLAVLGVDPDGLIVQCNKKGLEIFSMEEGNILGMYVNDALSEDINAFIDKTLDEGSISGSVEQNGAEINARGVHMKHSSGQEGIILVFEEGDEQRRLE